MHYINGKEAKQGDKVIWRCGDNYGFGILHTLSSSSDTCNGRVAVISQNDPYVTIKECLKVEDAYDAVKP